MPTTVPSTALTPSTGRFLAFDTSTDRMSIGVSDGAQQWVHEGAGGPLSSATLIPAILQLLDDAGLRLNQLDAIAFGRGPGSFTGLRTACAVAQGLALGAGVPVLPVDSLLALAEEARFQWALENARPQTITALLDARMDEMYVQHFRLGHGDGTCQALAPCVLVRPEALQLSAVLATAKDSNNQALHGLAGNVFEVYAARLPALEALGALQALPVGCLRLTALPSAAAMLRLAPGLLAAGAALDASQALPLYIRDKVALTTDERAEVKRQTQLERTDPPRIPS
jgi:tRNA threonylcarbamoyladenosine biosynthesis protein TsaB